MLSLCWSMSGNWHDTCCLVKITLEHKLQETTAMRQERASQTPRKEQMANLLHFAMAVASVVALLIVSPRRAQRKAITALTEYADMESSLIYNHSEADVPCGTIRMT